MCWQNACRLNNTRRASSRIFAESVSEYWLVGLEGVCVHVEDISGETQVHVKKVCA